jgi:hypothetical protein
MINEVDILKAQSEALRAYLMLQEGLYLSHGHCLGATAAVHGHRDWSVVAALGRVASADPGIAIQSHSSGSDQAARLERHFLQKYDFVLTEGTEATAAMRWGSLIEQANVGLGDPFAASKWLRQPHPQLGHRSPHELIGTDAGYEQIERLFSQLASSSRRPIE